MQKKSDLDFEISFYENLIKEKPDFVEALIPLGNAYTKSGRYKEGLQVDKRLSKLRPDDPVIFYNLGCSYSLLKMKSFAIKALKRALELGYDDFEHLTKDEDLKNIREDKKFNELIIQYVKEKFNSIKG